MCLSAELSESNKDIRIAVSDTGAGISADKEIKAILMDCQMPVMDGFEATRRIRKHPFYSAIPIIAVTANVSDEDHQNCIDCGMSDYLTKPVRKVSIERALSKWLAEPAGESIG